MKYSAGKGYTAAAFAAACFLMASCTEVDDRLGAGIIPKNQQMSIEISSPAAGVRTLLFKRDSVPSSRTGHVWLGRTTDASGVFGSQTSSALLQFLPTSWAYNYNGYGLDPIVDSARIIFTISGARGDTTAVQRFEVWDINGANDPLTRDTTYYANFPIERYRGQRLFEFTVTGRRDVATRLFPTAAGKQYLDSIVRIGWDDYSDDSLFRRKFQGLYIAPAADSPTAAALYGATLASSGMQLYVRNHDTLDRSAIYDTMVTSFLFRDTDQTNSDGSTTSWANVSVGMTGFDYAGSVLGGLQAQTNNFTDTLVTSTPLSTVYVQTGGGVGTYMLFSDELIEELRALRATVGADGKDMAINQAMLRVWTTDNSVEAMDRSIARLGSYLKMSTLQGIPDYQYASEAYQKALHASNPTQYDDFDLPYGGYLNRSNGYYELDVTSYVQQLMKIKEGDPAYRYTHPAFYLAPEAYGMFGTGQTILKGTGSDRPVSVRVTYTIIKG